MRQSLFLFCALSLTVLCGPVPPEDVSPVKVLLWLGGPIHNHHEIGNVIEPALRDYGRFDVTRVENDLDAFLPERLEGFDVVLFFNTLGEISEPQKRGVMNFVAGGKGIVGFHSAADSFRGDPDWDALFGGHFVGHPPYRTFQVSVLDTDSPITQGMTEFMVTDEQYLMEYDSRVRVLCAGLHRGTWVPTAWTKNWGRGRVFYTTLGHNPDSCRDENFQKLLFRGCLWAAGQEDLDAASKGNS